MLICSDEFVGLIIAGDNDKPIYIRSEDNSVWWDSKCGIVLRIYFNKNSIEDCIEKP